MVRREQSGEDGREEGTSANGRENGMGRTEEMMEIYIYSYGKWRDVVMEKKIDVDNDRSRKVGGRSGEVAVSGDAAAAAVTRISGNGWEC
jgi:hypothetical protein